MPKYVLSGIVLFVLATALAGVVFLKLPILSSLTKKPTPVATPTPSKNNPRGQIPSFPLSPSNPGVKFLSLHYTLGGEIKDIKGTPEELELVLDIAGPNIPQFIVDKDTKIFFKSGDQKTPANSTDLQVNQKLLVTAVYKVKKKTWTTTTVEILQSNVAPSPATSEQNP